MQLEGRDRHAGMFRKRAYAVPDSSFAGYLDGDRGDLELTVRRFGPVRAFRDWQKR